MIKQNENAAALQRLLVETSCELEQAREEIARLRSAKKKIVIKEVVVRRGHGLPQSHYEATIDGITDTTRSGWTEKSALDRLFKECRKELGIEVQREEDHQKILPGMAL